MRARSLVAVSAVAAMLAAGVTSPASAAPASVAANSAAVAGVAAQPTAVRAAKAKKPKKKPHPSFRARPINRAVVPVSVSKYVGGVEKAVRGAKIVVYAPRTTRGDVGPRIIGTGKTGGMGVKILVLKSRRAPKKMVVRVTGGRAGNQRFGRASKTIRNHKPGSAVIISKGSSLSASKTMRSASMSTANSTGISQDCAMKTTAGFATWLGFSNVPNDTTYGSIQDSCQARSTTASRNKLSARAAPGVIGTFAPPLSLMMGLISLSLASNAHRTSRKATTGEMLSQISGQLDQIKITLDLIGDQLTALSSQIAVGDFTDLSQQAAPTINAIKGTYADVDALVAAAIQVVCGDKVTSVEADGCPANPNFAGTMSQAMANVCPDPNTLDTDCNAYFVALGALGRRITDDLVLEDVAANLASLAIGSASGTGVGYAGIVQYALSLGGSNGFFRTEDAANQRVQWAYYATYTLLLQALDAIVLAGLFGQPREITGGAPITLAGIQTNVSKFNPTINAYLGSFPNMPDTAVINTGSGKYMWAQQVGAVMNAYNYTNGFATYVNPSTKDSHGLWQLTEASQIVSTDPIGLAAPRTPGSGASPLVMTPAAANGETWQPIVAKDESEPISDKNPAIAGPVPSMTFQYMSDWSLGHADPENETPEYKDSTNPNVQAANGGLAGPLFELYSGLVSNSNQTAGQQMATNSGINSALLAPNNPNGYGDTGSQSGASLSVESNDKFDPPQTLFAACAPAGNSSCLMPTWQTGGVDPSKQLTTPTDNVNTGLFDYNNGVVALNQVATSENSEHFYNKSLNWALPNIYVEPEVWADPYDTSSFVQALNGINQGHDKSSEEPSSLGNAGFNSAGRPVLFARQQAANDCFFWNNAEDGIVSSQGGGCLIERTKSSEILPAAPKDPPPPTQPPGMPINLTGWGSGPQDHGTVHLEWTASPEYGQPNTGYLYMCTNKLGVWEQQDDNFFFSGIALVNGESTYSVDVPGVGKQNHFYCVVDANNGVGEFAGPVDANT